MPVTDEEVVTKLRQLLADVDMETTTGGTLLCPVDLYRTSRRGD